MKFRTIVFYAAIASFLFVQTGFAATAVLNSAGKVQVNGRYVPATTPVFAGDRVETNEQSTGTVSLAETALQIQPDSSMVFSNDSVELLKGQATVKTAKAYSASVHGFSIRPEVNASEFMVRADASKVTISALKGSLTIGSHIKLPQGQTIVLATASATQGTGCVDGHKTDGNGKFLLDAQGRFIDCVARQGTGPAVTTISDNTKQWTAITFAAAGAAGATAVAIVKTTEKAPVSPAGP